MPLRTLHILPLHSDRVSANESTFHDLIILHINIKKRLCLQQLFHLINSHFIQVCMSLTPLGFVLYCLRY